MGYSRPPHPPNARWWQSAILSGDTYAAAHARWTMPLATHLSVLETRDSPFPWESLGTRTTAAFRCSTANSMLGGNLCCGWLARIRTLLAPPAARTRGRAVAFYPILPAETWAAIAAYLYDPADSGALSQTCRSLQWTGQARLFSRVDLLELRSLARFAATLQRDCAVQGPLSRYVRLLRITIEPHGVLEGNGLRGAVDALRTVLAHCTNLRVLALPNWTAPMLCSALPSPLPHLRSLEVHVDEEHGNRGPWFMILLHASPELRELRVWGTFALHSGVSGKLGSFTGDLTSAAAAIQGRPLRRIQLVGAVDVDEVVFQLRVDHDSDDPVVELLLRPSSDEPSEYLSTLRDGFPCLRRLTVLGAPSKFADEVIRGASKLPTWPSLRELVIYCDDQEGIELDEPAFTRCLLRNHRGLRSVGLRKALPYDLCLQDVMLMPD